MRTPKNCMKQYKARYLKALKEVTRVLRPSRIRMGTHDMSNFVEVKGEATDASDVESAIPRMKRYVADSNSVSPVLEKNLY